MGATGVALPKNLILLMRCPVGAVTNRHPPVGMPRPGGQGRFPGHPGKHSTPRPVVWPRGVFLSDQAGRNRAGRRRSRSQGPPGPRHLSADRPQITGAIRFPGTASPDDRPAGPQSHWPDRGGVGRIGSEFSDPVPTNSKIAISGRRLYRIRHPYPTPLFTYRRWEPNVYNPAA